MSSRNDPSARVHVRGVGERPARTRYPFAVVAAAAALVVEPLLRSFISEAPLYMVLVLASAVSVWYGGLGPGLLTTALAWGVGLWVVAEPRNDLAIAGGEELLRWSISLALGVGLVVLVATMRRSRQRVQAASQGMRMFRDLAAALSRAVSAADVADVVTAHASLLLDAQGATLGLVEGEDLVVVEPVGIAALARLPGDRIPLAGAFLITHAAREGVVVEADDRESLERLYPDSARQLPGVCGAIAMPLRMGDHVDGALSFLFERENVVTADVIAVASTIADLAGQALGRARLFERERESRQALDRVLRVAPSFHGDDLDDVAAAICREARTTFGADYGVLWRVRQEELELVHIYPPHPASPPGRRVRLDDFPALDEGVTQLRVSFVPDVLAEARGEGVDFVQELGIRSSLRSPITIGGQTRAVLVTSWQMVVSEPDPSTVLVLRRFADQAGLALEELERRRAEAYAQLRAQEMEQLQAVTAALSQAATADEVSNTCLDHALRIVGADAGFVVVTRPGGTALEFVTSSGYADHELDRWREAGLDANVPVARAIASGHGIWALTRDEMAAYTDVPGHGDAGWITLPLQATSRVQGALHLSFRTPKTLGAPERRLLETVASQCGLALARSLLYQEEQLLRQRSERLQSMTAKIANALTRIDVAQLLVNEVAPAVGSDGAAVAVVAEDQQHLRTVAWTGYSDDLVEPWQEVPLDAITPGTYVVRQRASTFYESPGAMHADFPALVGLTPPVGHSSFLFVPLVAGRRANGLLTVSWSERTTISDEDRTFVEALAGQAALALDRAGQFEFEQTIAETLQRSVLPASLPRVEGVQLAARYLPGTSDVDVGGDWFDAMLLHDGRLGLVIGDVVGKGVYAAASMGQLRNALRAFSFDRLKPSSALSRLNRLADELLDTAFATVVYVVVDPTTMVCRFASAGHPPPVLVYPDDRVEFLEGARGLPLGTGITAKYRQAVAELPAGTLLLLYSDGLVERRGRSIDEGLSDLCNAVREAPKDAERLLDHVLEAVVGPEERGDDIALLAARFLPVAPRPLDLRVPNRVGSLHLVRDALRVWLGGVPLTRTESEDVLLATWEACANAVEHAVEPTDDLVRIRARHDDHELTIVVEDSGRWAGSAQRPNRGRGLLLMERVMSNVDVATTDGGTRVTLAKAIAAAPEDES